jgi:hypothetical protein
MIYFVEKKHVHIYNTKIVLKLNYPPINYPLKKLQANWFSLSKFCIQL